MSIRMNSNDLHAPGPGKPGEVPRPGTKPDPKPDQQPPTITPQEVPVKPGRKPEPTREHPFDPKPAIPTSRSIEPYNGRNT